MTGCREHRRESLTQLLGAGVSLFVVRHIAIRPDVDVKIVRRNSRSYAVTAVAVRLAYHFEEHPLESFSAG